MKDSGLSVEGMRGWEGMVRCKGESRAGEGSALFGSSRILQYAQRPSFCFLERIRLRVVRLSE